MKKTFSPCHLFLIVIVSISSVFSKNTEWIVYNTSNSGLPNNHIASIAIDFTGNKWIGTGSGLAKFDGTNWTVYNTSNSDLPDNGIKHIVTVNIGNVWIGADF